MNKNIIIANWKMKLGLEEAGDLAVEIEKGVDEMEGTDLPEVVLCPSFVGMSAVSKLLGSKKIVLGAQDSFWEERGSYTGEVSPRILNDLGCRYFIIGHSERRQYLGETDLMVHKKIKAVLEVGGLPIVCVGETREQRNRGEKDNVVIRQVERAFNGIELKDSQKVIIAYEPVWVIGVGQAVEAEDVEYMVKLIRHTFLDFCPEGFARNNLRIIYGGSADSENVKEFITGAGVNGFLVGTASLDSGEFLNMVELMGR